MSYQPFPFEMNNVLVTRKCNLTCDYCRIIRDYHDSPYQKLDTYNEVPYTKWVEFGEWLKDNGDGFVIIYGGEPFIYQDIEKLIEEYNNKDISYTVITNSTRKNEALDLVKKGILRSLSASVDPFMFGEVSSKDKSRLLKSNKGLDLLISAKEINSELDAVAEIVLDNTNYKYIDNLVEYLTEHNVWSSITIIESPKNIYYDFAEPCDNLLLSKEEREYVKNRIHEFMDKGLLIHAPEAVLSTLDKGDETRCTLNQVYHTTTIEPNGDIRLCLRIKGQESSKHNIFDYIDQGLSNQEVNDKILQSIKEDYNQCCEGCAWTCVHMYKSGLNEGIKHKGG